MTTTGAAIRAASADDLDAVVALTHAAYAPWTALLGVPPIPVTEDYAPRIADGGVWLLESGFALAGLLVLERHADHLLIFSVAVAPPQQGRGFGIRLLAWADAQARAAGVAQVRLYTNARMERNIALYTAYGYRETARYLHPLRPGFIRVDMARTLPAWPATR